MLSMIIMFFGVEKFQNLPFLQYRKNQRDVGN